MGLNRKNIGERAVAWGGAQPPFPPQQTTSRLALLAYFCFRPRQFFPPLPPDAEPGPRLTEW